MSTEARDAPTDVLIVGGGIAGIEALMALADLGGTHLRLHLVADRPTFVLPPQLLGVPWGVHPLHLDLQRLCRAFGADFTLGTVTAVDGRAHEVDTAGGEALPYERLLLASGGRHQLAYTSATRTLGFSVLPHELAEDVSGSVAIVVPAGASWTLPAYQLALQCAGDGRDVRVITDEQDALRAFGPGASAAVGAMLDRHGVAVETGGAPARGATLTGLADTVVALPLMDGPSITGLTLDADGFVPVDALMAVGGVEHVHAAGDVTDGPIKQGGLAAQQADTAAAEIVRSCGLEAIASPYEPVLRGKLTGREGDELYLRRALDGIDAGNTLGDPLWQPPSAICAWRLARWLDYNREELRPFTADRPTGPAV